MSNTYFTFKHFRINQDRCAMKVGTDGCLLGAWADISNSKRILDVGCGSGLIAIMVAQRSNATVTGIEIDPDAAAQASENVSNSPWNDRVEIICCDASNYNSDEKFDAIISNPPFFSNSLRCPAKERTLARHNDTLSATNMFTLAKSLLADNGTLSVVIPCDTLQEWSDEALFKGFSIQRMTTVRTLPHKPAKRALVEFTKGTCHKPVNNEFTLEEKPGIYSMDTKKLLQEFYLKL